MKRANFLLFAMMSLWGFGCSNGDPAGVGQAGESAGISAYDGGVRRICPIEGTILEGNSLVLTEAAIRLVIKADSSTLDPVYGESHRILEVYDTRSCSLLTQKILPVNESPDFPYFLAEINYNHSSKQVAIRGAFDIYCFDVPTGRLLPPLTPVFEPERNRQDAQSGMIQRLELWELFLVGHARDYGAFVFDLTDTDRPRAVVPFSTYRDPVLEDWHDLFLLPSEKGGYQALMPVYDGEEQAFFVHALFPEPLDIEAGTGWSGEGTPYVIFRKKGGGGTALVADMRTRALVSLPAALGEQDDAAILGWLHQNNL